MKKSWIEPVLERNLRPVAAPAELWDRVCNPPARERTIFPWKLAVALVLAVATAWALHPRAASMESDRATAIREWVLARTGLDVPLAPASDLRLCGSHVAGNALAEIRYKVRGQEATLLVARADRYTAGHEFAGRNSWILRGQSYTVTGADLQSACRLCHIDAEITAN